MTPNTENALLCFQTPTENTARVSPSCGQKQKYRQQHFEPFNGEQPLTVEAIDGLLPQAASDTPVDPLVLVALVLKEVLEQVQHLCHLGKKQQTGQEDCSKWARCL